MAGKLAAFTRDRVAQCAVKRARDAEADAEALETTGLRVGRRALVQKRLATCPEAAPYAHTLLHDGCVTDVPPPAAPPPRLRLPRQCYVCASPYKDLHAFYDSLCPPCAALNFAKRSQTADLTGRVAVVTGGRVKIGVCLCMCVACVCCVLACVFGARGVCVSVCACVYAGYVFVLVYVSACASPLFV